MDLFTNNASSVLTAALEEDSGATTIEVASTNPFSWEIGREGKFQRATISNPSMPDAIEIVKIVGKSGSTLTVERAVESMGMYAWPVGSKIEARITAGQLASFLQAAGSEDGSAGVVRTNYRSFVLNGRSVGSEDSVQIAGVQMLQPVRAADIDATYYGPGASTDVRQDMNMSVESVGGSPFVMLGDIPLYSESKWDPYLDGDTVRLPEALGHNYMLFQRADATESGVNPLASAFGASGDPVPVLSQGGEEVAQWVAVPDPLDIGIEFPNDACLVLSEVGFICSKYGPEGTDEPDIAPTVTVFAGDLGGGPDSESVIADHVVLDGAQGRERVHRIPVPTFGKRVKYLRFQLNTAAGGIFNGRFYWRGFFFNLGN